MSAQPPPASLAPPPPPLVRHVLRVLACDDVVRLRDFYVAVFGWRVTVDLPVYVELDVPTGLRVGLYVREGFARNTHASPAPRPSEATTASELYLRVDDVPAALARLVAAGGRLLSPTGPRPWGDEAAYVSDPEGKVVAVACPLAL